MEKIEVPQAVYDEYHELERSLLKTPHTYLNYINNHSDSYSHLYFYLFCQGLGKKETEHQLNLAKVMSGEAEFVPIEEKYYWQDKQDRWLGRASYLPSGVDNITTFPDKSDADKLTETEIRDKTSFDIDKLEKVSE